MTYRVCVLQLILSDIENHRRLVNELTERVANLEALCDNPEVSASLEDVQSRYNDILYKAKVAAQFPLYSVTCRRTLITQGGQCTILTFITRGRQCTILTLITQEGQCTICLLYTSDAADER